MQNQNVIINKKLIKEINEVVFHSFIHNENKRRLVRYQLLATKFKIEMKPGVAIHE